MSWRESSNQPAHAVAVVVHGFNTDPSKMFALENVLRADGMDVLHVALTGHNHNFNAFRNVTFATWERDVLRASCLANLRAKELRVPLYYLGYSLGGLLAVDLLQKSQVQYNKMIFIAPALSIRRYTAILNFLRKLSRYTIIPGLGTPCYLANPGGVPVSAFLELFDGVKMVNAKSAAKANVPTLIFIDPFDELISPSGLENFIEEKNMTNWWIHPVYKIPFSFNSLFHHIIIDKETLGERHWNEMKKEIRDFFGD